MAGTNGKSSYKTTLGAQMDADHAKGVDADPKTRERQDTNPRLARILLLQQAIAAGRYNVPAQVMAEKMIDDLLHKPKETIMSPVPPIA